MSERGRPAPDEIEPGIPATEEVRSDVPPGWEAAEEPAPLDVPQGVETWGTTVDEETRDEPLYQRVRREEPDRLTSAAGQRDVALIEPGDEDGVDEEADLVAEVDPERQPLSAEEAALRIEDEDDVRLGLNQDPDPGYVQDE